MKNIILLATLMTAFGCSESDEKIVYAESSTGFETTPDNIGEDTNTTPDEYSAVTKEFGALTVREGEFSGTTEIIPWSSWWFPTKDKYLFESANSRVLAPLQKYDAYVENKYGTNPDAALFEEMEIYDPSEVNWAGLCHAWAIASVLHVEPAFEQARRGMTLSVADQKALMLKSYENVKNLKIYGSRYNGVFNDNFSDVYPEQFHRFAQVFLFERNLPFLMDFDPSFPVWTVPVYNIKFIIVKESETSVHVKVWATTASSFVEDPNFVGTKKSVKYYEYKLYGTWQGLDLNVTGSEWVNDSLYDHPDFLIAYPENVTRASLNSNLEISKIDEIIGTRNVRNN